MSFIRAKEIPPGSGNWYDYEVESVWKNGTCRQKHLRYIGRSGRSSIGSGVHRTPVMPDIQPANDDYIYKMKTPARQIASAMDMYYGGMPLDAIQQQFKQDYDMDMSESNYWNWVTRFTKEAVNQCKSFHPAVGDTWVADETYMKIGDRNVYFWDIIDSDTRYLLATHVSFTRSGRDARLLMRHAANKAKKNPKVVVTDKLGSYIVGVGDEFGSHSAHHQGGPFNVENNTNLIERFHRTLEQRTKVFQKFKDIDTIKLLTDGWLINYNFFKQHGGVGDIPPAQAANKVVPCKDWNDIVRPESVRAVDYKVRLSRRPTARRMPVVDATLTPITEGASA